MIILYVLLGIVFWGLVVFLLNKQQQNHRLAIEEQKLKTIQQDITKSENEKKQKENEAREILKEAKNEVRGLLENAKSEVREMKQDLDKSNKRIEEKELRIENKEKDLDKKVEMIQDQKANIKSKEEELDNALDNQKQELEKIAKLTQEEAKEELIVRVEKQTSEVLSKKIDIIQKDLEEDSKKKSQEIITQTIQRYAADVATEKMITIVELQNDEMKGRIIGREGRNINSIEQATGVDVIVDDTPNVIMISGFDLLRRYVAKTLIEKLLEDGRIHPARIEELAEKVRQETNDLIKETGEKALLELGITGIHPDIVKILWRLHFRTSYGQNQLNHCTEVAHIAGSIAEQIGYDVQKAKTAGLLHDIGKAVDHTIEGGHAEIGYKILKKYNVEEEIAKSVGAHHADMVMDTPLDFIVAASDAISGARPGARRESFDAYVKRLRQLEDVANSFEGVKQTYAIQAGREVRVLVNPEKVDDFQAKKLSLDISQKIEQDLNYPGQIKVQVIRETRTIEFAK